MTAAIECRGVHRHFKDVRAVDGVDLVVDEHQIFGLLGPNGSGKTTLLNQMQGLDQPTDGTVTVLGLDPIRDRAQLVRRFGTQLQESTIIPRLTVKEALTTFASFYEHTRGIDELLAELGLTAKADARVEKLSGGQRQRVFIALALLHDPELLFFDELTSAVDPQARLAIWDVLRGLREQGRTIILTTHSMEEAQELCDKIAIIDAGKIIAEGTTAELIAAHGGGTTLRLGGAGAVADDVFLGIDGVTGVAREGLDVIVTGMKLEEATLEDVFLALTGRRMREGE